jgi:hypothetical protein
MSRWLTLELSQSLTDHISLSAFICGKDSLPAALAPRVRRIAWIHGYERVHASDVMVGAREPAPAEAGVRESARLTVQGISTGWFERHCRAGFCRRLGVQGVDSGNAELGFCAGAAAGSGFMG